jgi:DNA-directed RNA polymerase subunit K/omega
MPKESKDKEESKPEQEEPKIDLFPLTHIPGVGPKTAEKLISSGYDSLEKVAKGKAEDIAATIPGLSVPKAEGVIEDASNLVKAIESGELDLQKTRASKRKKAQEPAPEKHELPPAQDIEQSVELTTLLTGLEKNNREKGVPIGPRWLTKFERARIVGARALQISMGAPILAGTGATVKGLFTLAEQELKNGRLPMTVRRTLPTGQFHDIPLSILLDGTKLD